MDVVDILQSGLAAYELPACGHPERFDAYLRMLLTKNEVMNLTAITDPEEAVRKHFLDSLALFKAVELTGKSVIDVGCGAGFPGLPLRLYDDTIDLALLDSLGKRVEFLKETTDLILGEGAVSCIHARAEEYAVSHREQYDIAVSRAVANLQMLAELCLPYVKVGGYFCPMKSTHSDEELQAASNAIKLLGGSVERYYDYTIPGLDVTQRIILIKKIKATPVKYPRRFAKIKQQPL